MKTRFYTIAVALLLICTGADAQVNKSKTRARKPQTAVKRTPAKAASTSGQKAMFCPNNKHPHAIDLGLPSETMWSCCNVDAHSPEQYGGLYALAEVKTKKNYSMPNYRHYNGDEYINNRAMYDFCGTGYDVAHVKWGGDWVMPTHQQFRELFEECTYEWTTINGVSGAKFIGPNGNIIFLPAGGFSNKEQNQSGNYWPCTTYDTMLTHGYYMSMMFSSARRPFLSSYSMRYMGHSVRPVKRR